jgi:hypothetical protein
MNTQFCLESFSDIRFISEEVIYERLYYSMEIIASENSGTDLGSCTMALEFSALKLRVLISESYLLILTKYFIKLIIFCV